jgi:hypothetical protein
MREGRDSERKEKEKYRRIEMKGEGVERGMNKGEAIR